MHLPILLALHKALCLLFLLREIKLDASTECSDKFWQQRLCNGRQCERQKDHTSQVKLEWKVRRKSCPIKFSDKTPIDFSRRISPQESSPPSATDFLYDLGQITPSSSVILIEKTRDNLGKSQVIYEVWVPVKYFEILEWKALWNS